MKSDYCDEAYDRVITASVSDDKLFSQIKLLGYNKDEGKKEISIEYGDYKIVSVFTCLLYTSPSPRDALTSRMPSSA